MGLVPTFWLIPILFLAGNSLALPFKSQLTDIISQANIREVICDGEQANLMCSAEEGINIVHAYYGREVGHLCPSEDGGEDCQEDLHEVMNSVKGLCQEHQLCSLTANANVLSTAARCHRTKKYLKVAYECRKMSGGADK